MATSLSTLRNWLNIRLGRQYNSDDDGKALLDLWINEACRFIWEKMPMGFNETSTTTIPTITDDRFTLPAAAISLMWLKRSTGSGSANYESDIDYSQEGRTITIKQAGETPDRMAYHSHWTELDAVDETLDSSLPAYLVVELAAYFAAGETKDQNDNSPIQINKAMNMLSDFYRQFSIRRDNASSPYGQDGRRIERRGGVYSAGEAEGRDDTKDVGL